MTTSTVRRLAPKSAAPVLCALLAAAGCGRTDPLPASFDPAVASPYGSAWTVTGNCGNGALDAGEACDDGNGLPGDGCTAACVVETDYSCTAAAPVAIANGGFNAQAASIPGATGTQITGWTVTANSVDLLVPLEPQASWLLTAEGTGMVDLAGTASNGTLQRDLPTVDLQSYVVHFAYAARCPGTTPCSRTFTVEAANGATVLTTARFTGGGDPQPSWRIGTVAFRATGATTQLRFIATDADTTNGALIDAVSLPASSCYLVPQLSCMTPESAASDLTLGGTATITSDSIQANPATTNQLGAAFSNRTFAPSSFTAVARLRIGSPSATPADGFALVFQNDPRGPAAIGCPGEGLGYGQQPACTTPVISPSVAVEIDTYFNAAWDAGYPNPHIAIDANGNVLHASPAVMPAFPMVNATFTVWVDFNLATRTLQVFGSAGTAKPATPILVHTLTPAQATVFDSPFYAGITGSTGGSYETQEILYYSISTTGIVDEDGDGKDDRCTVCGNGYVDATGEECDDGNTLSGDGCSATCTREAGITCTGVPSTCTGRCGDGIVASTEGCDDGNTAAADGCSATCQPESGYVCSAPPAIDALLVIDGATQCAATGSASTANPTALPAGRYGLFYATDAVQTSTTTYQAAIEARSSTDGSAWTNTPIVSTPAATAAAAIGNALGNRGFFRTNGSTSWFFFPDGSCGDDGGTTSWRLRGVSLCEAIPDTTLGARPASLSNTADPSLGFTANVTGSTFECSLDGAPFAACTNPKGYSGLAQGAHIFAVRAVNGAAVDPSPATWNWTIDSLVSAPVITFPAAGAQVPGSPTVTGTAEPGATVTVTEGVATLCAVLADPSGNWSCATTLGDGSHTLLAGQVDLALNASATSSVAFTVASSLPAVALAAPAVINAANAATYPVGGACDATGGDVTIQVGAVSSTTPCTAGSFSTALDVRAVPDAASVAMTAAQTNVNGTGTSARAALKDTVVAPPVIAAPTAGALVAASPTVAGTAEPGAAVVVRNGATVLCTLTADASGGWSCATTLAANPYSLTAAQTDPAGNPSANATVDFTVVTAPIVAVSSNAVIWSGNAAAYPVTGACASLAGAVTVTVGTVSASATCIGNGFTATLDLSSLADGPSITITATQTNPAGTGTGTRSVVKDTVALPPAIASPAEGSEAAVNPTLAGHTEDLATVTVMNGATAVCTVAADSSGNWSCATTLGVGSYTLTSTQVDAAGNTSGTATRSFTVVGPPVVVLTAPGPINIANTAAYPIAGSCTTGAGPVSISVGTLTPTTTACTAGAFSGTFNTTGQGASTSVTVKATQTNGAGTGTDTRTTIKDVTAPAAPAIVYPTNGQVVSDTPAISGTAEPGAAVVVREGATTICSATADGSGNWTCGASGLAAGAHAITATQTDVAGNTGAASAARDFTVNTAYPDVAIDSPVAAINAANVTSFVVTGTCTIGAGNVTIRVGTNGANGTQAVACSAGGTWTTAAFNVSAAADGTSVQVRASQTLTGNTTQVSEYTRKDTAVPAVPVISVPAAAAEVTASTTLSGTSEASATVTVREGASTVCTTTATTGGAWSCAVTLSAGAHSITATQTDLALNTSAASAARAFTVVGPPTVVVTAPAVINAANAAAYAVGGSCTTTAGAVTVTVGSISATPACTAGAFTTTLNVSTLADASAILVGATQTNVAGTATDTKTTRKDSVVAAPVIALPVSGTVVPPSPTVSGTGEPGSTVTVVRAGPVTVCTPVVDGTGSWSCATALGVGSYSLTATQLDTAGNTSAASGAHPFTVEILPVVTLDPPAVIRSANVTAYPIGGTCTGTSFVTVSVGTATGTTACSGGTFARTLDVSAVADGASVTVTASQSNAAGSDSDSAGVLKDTFAAPPVIASPASGAEAAANPSLTGTAEPGASVTVDESGLPICATVANGLGAWSCPTTLAVGLHSLTAVQTDVHGNDGLPSAPHAFTVVAAPAVAVAAPGPINGANATAYPIAGTCTGSYAVTVQVGTLPSATTGCAAGAFATTFDTTGQPDSLTVTVSASQTNVAGTGSDARTTAKDTVAPAAPAITTPAAAAEVAANPTLSGTAEPGATVTVSEGAATVCTATADGAGAWSCATTLGNGSHTLTAAQTDAAGNPGPASAGHAFWVGPPVVALAAPATITGANAAAYTVSGSCSGAADVTVTVGTVTASPAPACVAGAFTVTFDVTATADGAAIGVTASQSNAQGTGSDSATVLKDTAALPPAFVSPAAGATVDLNPTLAGTGEPGATVTVRDGGATVCTALVDGSGDWSCATTLGSGGYSLDATQTDSLGNVSPTSAPHAFSVLAAPIVALAAPAVIFTGNAASYPVAGSCTGSYTVTVQVGTASTATACSGAAFATTLDVSSVADGLAVAVVASQTNASGTGSDTRSTLKDTVAPAPPAIASPAAGAEVAASPALTGTAEPLATVTVLEGAATVCVAVSDAAGDWTCATTLGSGPHSLTAAQVDAAGNAGPASAPHPLWIGPPVVLLDPLATVFSGNAAAYPVSGACTGAAAVTVTVGAVTATPACTVGTFATTLDLQLLADAPAVTVTASQSNVAGTGSDSADVLKDTVVAPPAIATPLAGSAVAANPSLTGTAEPGASVTVTELAATVCTATADGAGDWSCPTTLGNGPHSLTAAQTDVAGNGSLPSASHDLFVGPPAVALDPLAVIRSANVADYSVTGSCSAGQGDVTVQVGSGPSTSQVVACGAGGTFATASPFDVSAVPDAASVSVSASQANAVGPGSDTGTTRKDTVALPPVVTAPTEGGSAPASVTFTGTAEPGAAVSVDEGTQLCAAIADGAGDWSCGATLAIGPHSVLVAQVDVDLNVSGATARAFSVIDLPVVSVDGPATINAANAAAYDVTGGCTAGAGDVTVTVGSAPPVSTACSLGSFAATLDVSAVPDAASVTVTASQTNASGTGSGFRTTLKDTAAPAAPAISSPAAGAEVAARPTLSGSAEPGAAVTVRDGASTVCTATADGLGAWSCTPSSDLAPGAHSLTATQTDTAGNPGPASAAHSLTVVVAPSVALAVPAVIFSGNAAAYPVSGSCTGSYTVTVQVGTASTTTGCSGDAFTATLDVTGLADAASVTVSASQTNAAGTGTDSRSTRKDATTPAAPAIVTPAAASEVAPNPTLSGTAEPDAAVTVREGATPVCAATADAGGAWSCATTLAVGGHTLTATQTDTAGNTGSASSGHTFTVAATPVVALAPPAVIFSGNAAAYPVSGSCTGAADVDLDVGGVTGTAPCTAGAFSATLDVSGIADAASVTVSASQTNVVGTGADSATVLKDTAVVPPSVASPAPGAEVTARPTVTGTAEPGAAVTVLDGAATLCTATADGSGTWSCTPAADLAPGAHSLTASQVDAAGNASAASGALAVTVVAPPTVALGALAVIFSGNAGAYPVSGSCTGAWTVTVSVGSAGGTTPCSGGTFSTTVDASGVPDASGVAVTAAQSNAAGAGTDAATVLKDTVAAAPAVVAPAAGASVAAGPSISGTAEPFATIAVTEGGPSVCTAAVAADAAGNWSCATALGAGSHTVSAVQTDTAGNVSAATARSFTVDVALPVVALAPLDVINGANVTAYPVTGACSAGDGNVAVSVGTVAATVPCAGAGTFSATLDVSALAESQSVAVRAAQTNAGGTGADVRTTAKDTVANAPVIASPAAGALVAPGPVISGTAEPFAAVELAEGATILCTVAADAAGGWSCATALGVGAHTVSASQTDAAGNASAASTRTFTVDVALPVVALAPLPAVNGANAAAYAVIGTCDPAAGDVTVTVDTVNGTSPCTGTFSVALDLTGVADAPSVSVTAAQTNAGGTGSDSRSVVKDTVALPPAILSPAAGGTVAPGPSVSGTAEPGASVTVTEGGLPVCASTADPLGSWSCATSLGVGAHTVDAVQSDLAGNGSATSSRTFTVVGALPPVALDAPAVVNAANAAAYPVSGSCGTADGDVTVQVGTATLTTACAAGRFSAALDVRAVADGPVTVSGSQTNGSGTGTDGRATLKDTVVAPPAVLAPTEGQHVATATPPISGTAEPGAVVTVTVGGAEVGRVTADGAGAWSVTPAAALDAGDNVASVVQQDAAGNTSAATARSFVVDTGAAPTLDSPVAGAALDYDRPMTFAGTAAPGATVTVSIDGTIVGTTTADGTGQWTLTLPARTLDPGAHSATATSGSLTSAARPFTVRLPEVEMTGGGCGCQGGAGSGGWAALLLVLGAALRRRPRRVRFPA